MTPDADPLSPSPPDPSPAPPVAAPEPRPGDLAVERLDAANPDDGRPGLLFCTGFHSSMAGAKASRLVEIARARGLGCTRFDYRGHGASAGDAATLGIGHWLADTLAVIDATPGPLVLIGSSMGAWLATLAARRRSGRVAGLMTLAAAPDFTERTMRPALGAAGEAALAAGRLLHRPSAHAEERWPIPPVLLEGGARHLVLGPERGGDDDRWRLDAPATLLHGTADADVPWALSLELMERRCPPGSALTLLAGADHRLSDPDSLEAMERALDALLGRVARTGRGPPDALPGDAGAAPPRPAG